MEILQQTKTNYSNYSIEDLKIEPPLPVTTEHVLFGIDPGTTKMGLAFIYKSSCHVFDVKIVRSDDAVARILLVHDILNKCFNLFDYAPLMTIEGSSYGNAYRQVELAEVRASAVIWAIVRGIKPTIVPPLSIRKKVFGSAKLTAEFGWKELPPDAASALACAYFQEK